MNSVHNYSIKHWLSKTNFHSVTDYLNDSHHGTIVKEIKH